MRIGVIWCVSLLLALAPAAAKAAESPQDLLRQANRFMAQGQYDLAIEAYRRVVALNHDPARVDAAHRWIANAQLKKAADLARQGKPSAALDVLKQVQSQSLPPDLGQLVARQRAEFLLKLRQSRDAGVAQRPSPARDPENEPDMVPWDFPRELGIHFGSPKGFLGFRVEIRDGQLTVAEVLKDSPAERAGLRAGDVIAAIDGQTAFPPEAVRRILDGAPKSKCRLEIRRSGQAGTRTVEIERAAPPVPGGIGVQIEMQDERPVILRVSKDSPAARAGLRTGDVILAVDGKPTARLNLRKVVELIRGKAGTRVKLEVRRGDETTITVELTRSPLPRREFFPEIRFPQYRWQMPQPGPAPRSFPSFGPEGWDSI